MDHHSLTLLNDIALCIGFAAVASHIVRVLKQPLILGYVLGGVLLGQQFGLGWVTQEASVELISEIGLILLLFIIGLEINLRELARMGKSMLTLGIVQFAGCVLLGMAFFKTRGYGLGGGNFDLLYISVALALSSTMIVVKLLHDKFEIHTAAGKLTVGILVLQDIWAIVFMAFQPNLLDPRIVNIARSLVMGVLLIICAFLASKHVLSRLFRSAAKSPELILLTSIAWCFLVGGLAEKAGLSKEMGALIAGVSIAAFPYGTDVIAKLAGIRDFFVTLFFVSLGLKIPKPSPELLLQSLGVAGFVLLSRLLSIVPTTYFLKKGIRMGCVTSLNLAQISEFSLVILSLGAGYGHVSKELQSLVLMSMVVTSILATYFILFNDPVARLLTASLGRLGLREAERAQEAHGKSDSRHDIILLGCFRTGEAFLNIVVEKAPRLKQRILVVDYNPDLQGTLKEKGIEWVYGDLAHPATLEHLGIEEAGTLICSIPDTFLKGTTNLTLLDHLKRLAPRSRYIMTADHLEGAKELLEKGATQVIVPSQLAGNRLFDMIRGLDA